MKKKKLSKSIKHKMQEIEGAKSQTIVAINESKTADLL